MFTNPGEKESTGNATVDLDSERFVQGSFKQILSKSGRGLDLATTDIEVVNDRVPVGVQYIHEFDASGNTVSAKKRFFFANCQSFIRLIIVYGTG